MSTRYEVKVDILDEDYLDPLIVSLVRNGYDVYMSWDSFHGGKKEVCFCVVDEDMKPIKGKGMDSE